MIDSYWSYNSSKIAPCAIVVETVVISRTGRLPRCLTVLHSGWLDPCWPFTDCLTYMPARIRNSA